MRAYAIFIKKENEIINFKAMEQDEISTKVWNLISSRKLAEKYRKSLIKFGNYNKENIIIAEINYKKER